MWSQTIISAGSGASLSVPVANSWHRICYHSVTYFGNDLIDVSASLGEYVSGFDLKNGQNESWRSSTESALGNGCLKSTCHAGQHKVLVRTQIVSWVLLSRH